MPSISISTLVLRRRRSNLPLFVAFWAILTFALGVLAAAEASPPAAGLVRIASAQPAAHRIDWHIKELDEVQKLVDQNLTQLEQMIDKAAAQRCDVVAFPENTLGLNKWLQGNPERAKEILPQSVPKMLSRFGAAAAKHKIYVLCCDLCLEPDGKIYNTAFMVGRDGKELGRYHKVCPTIHERVCTPGDKLPVINTKDLGGVGMLICYDMVFPEPARCLALGGADVIFHLTEGGAAIGDGEVSRAAFRTRAVENFVYIIVSQQNNGSMIISPKGEIIAEAQGKDSFAIADINPFGGREGGDAMNMQRDMRARLFRERNPAAFGILSDPNPPALEKLPATLTEQDAVKMAQKVMTVGEEEFKAAAALASQGKKEEAIAAYKRLKETYRDSWIDRVATERLEKLK